MSISFDLQKTPAFQAKVELLRSVLTSQMVDAVLLTAAMPVVNRAKERAAYKTGTLRRSIRAEKSSDFVRVGTDVPYGARIEFGFVGTDSRGRRYNQGPRPYLRPAIDETRQEVLAAGVSALRALVRSIT